MDPAQLMGVCAPQRLMVAPQHAEPYDILPVAHFQRAAQKAMYQCLQQLQSEAIRGYA